MGEKAARAAFADAGLPYEAVQQWSTLATSTATPPPVRPRVYRLGLSGVPIVNVNNTCATSSSALFRASGRWEMRRGRLARWRLASRRSALLALGTRAFADRPHPMERFTEEMSTLQGYDPQAAPGAAQMFGGAGAEYAKKHDTLPRDFRQDRLQGPEAIAQHNPYALFAQRGSTVEEVLGSPQIYGPLTRFQCCPAHLRGGGGDRLHPGLRQATRPGRRRGHRGPGHDHRRPQHFRPPFSDDEADRIQHGERAITSRRFMSRPASGLEDIRVVELHDCFTPNVTS